MKQKFMAECKNGVIVLLTNNKLLKRTVRKLQSLYSDGVYDKSLYLRREKNKKNDIFEVEFEYNNEYTLDECIADLENKKLEFQYEYNYFIREKQKIKDAWTNELISTTMRIHDEIYSDADVDLETAIFEVTKKINEIKDSIHAKYQALIDKLSLEFEKTKEEYSFIISK